MNHLEIVSSMLKAIGVDPEEIHTKDTPRRVVESWKELYSGYKFSDNDVEKMLTQFDSESYDEMVILKDIEFYSTCSHHLLPFFGKAHIGYIPDKKVVGISKLARLLEVYARRLQTQERIASQVTNALMKHLKPLGAGCVIEAKHMCIACRGIEKQHSMMVTSCLQGGMKTDLNCRQEFMNLIKGGSQ
jgi:GTP cyclohydrolase I